MRKIYKNRWLCYLLMLILLFCTGCGNQKSPDLSADVAVKDEQIIEDMETENEMIPEQEPEATLEEENGVEETEDAVVEEVPAIQETEETPEKEESDTDGVIFEKTETPNQGEVAPRLDFPIEIEGGKLTIESVFQYSGLNLDAEDAICEDIGAVQLKNTSSEYLESADVVVTLSGGTQLKFCIEDLPAGKSIIAFEVQNQVYDVSKSVENMTANAQWGNRKSLLDDKVTVITDGLQLTVKNSSGSTLKDLKVVYHCELDGVFFGGRSYEGIIEDLGAGKSAMLDASECYLGEAVVVCVSE